MVTFQVLSKTGDHHDLCGERDTRIHYASTSHIINMVFDINYSQNVLVLLAPMAMSIILDTQDAEIRRITVQNHPRQIVQETLS
jgi:hypothetical protein